MSFTNMISNLWSRLKSLPKQILILGVGFTLGYLLAPSQPPQIVEAPPQLEKPAVHDTLYVDSSKYKEQQPKPHIPVTPPTHVTVNQGIPAASIPELISYIKKRGNQLTIQTVQPDSNKKWVGRDYTYTIKDDFELWAYNDGFGESWGGPILTTTSVPKPVTATPTLPTSLLMPSSMFEFYGINVGVNYVKPWFEVSSQFHLEAMTGFRVWRLSVFGSLSTAKDFNLKAYYRAL